MANSSWSDISSWIEERKPCSIQIEVLEEKDGSIRFTINGTKRLPGGNRESMEMVKDGTSLQNLLSKFKEANQG
jgi:hypothetical protein|tara:strand:+ start:2257 stop:2478 length:222 start_codon:yes stop_codon:yes gene_type:complete